MSEDPEIVALNAAYEALKHLDQDAIERSLNWLATRMGVSLAAKARSSANPAVPVAEPLAKSVPLTTEPETEPGDIGRFETSAEFLTKIQEPNDAERVLAVAAYLQTQEPEAELTGFRINKELKHIGHGLVNITKTIGVWIEQKPQLMIQVRKSGTTRQAKKVYKVTDEGFKWVGKRLVQPAPQV